MLHQNFMSIMSQKCWLTQQNLVKFQGLVLMSCDAVAQAF